MMYAISLWLWRLRVRAFGLSRRDKECILVIERETKGCRLVEVDLMRRYRPE